jgi:hypothetical protein
LVDVAHQASEMQEVVEVKKIFLQEDEQMEVFERGVAESREAVDQLQGLEVVVLHPFVGSQLGEVEVFHLLV